MPEPTLLVKGSLVLSSEAKTAKANRETPINYIITWIKQRMPEYGYNKADFNDRILVVRAETGSGKSTVLPVEVFRILREKTTPLTERYNGKYVICTQPRVLTTISLANDVSGRAWNPDIVLGKTVGYQTGPSVKKPDGGLLYATAGVLSMQLEKLEDENIMSLYQFILVDEAHERSQDCDLLLMLLKNFYIRNKGNKNLPFLLLTSATFDTSIYLKYFNISKDNAVEIKGRAYPIVDYWPLTDYKDYIEESVSKAIKIHEENYNDPIDKCDILIFVPGIKQIKAVKEKLTKINKTYVRFDSKINPFMIITINRDNINSQSGDFKLLFIPPKMLPKIYNKTPKRRVVIATIVAETGLTIDTLKYVIDCGWNRTTEIYQPWGFGGLITRPAPKNKILQRKGRAGRLFPGEFYPLYTENTYKSLEDQQLPDFITSGIKDKFLSLVKNQQIQKINMGKFPEFLVEDITLLDPPSMESFIMSNSIAALLGFVSENAKLPKSWPPNFEESNIFGFENGYGLKELGHLASHFDGISMESIKMVFLSFVYPISTEDMINIAAIMKIENVFNIDEMKKKEILPTGAKILLESISNSNIDNFYNILIKLLGDKKFNKNNDENNNENNDKNNDEQTKKYILLKLFLSDDFIEILFIFEYFMDNITNTDIENWCTEKGLEYTQLRNALFTRNSIINTLYELDINPFHNESLKIKKLITSLKNEDNIEILFNSLKGIKKAIYGGYFNNLLLLNPDNNSYYNNQNIKIKLSSPYINLKLLETFTEKEYKPKWIITNTIIIKANSTINPNIPAPLLYTIQSDKISVMDGFVYPDFEYNSPNFEYNSPETFK